MYHYPYMYVYPYYVNPPMDYDSRQTPYWGYPVDPMMAQPPGDFPPSSDERKKINLKDHGNKPFTVNIEEAAEQNNTFRTTLWTGEHLQVTLMSIQPRDDIGLEVHQETDQFLRIEEGRGIVRMGNRKDNLTFERRVGEDDAIMVPAGTWHNIINTGRKPLKLYSIYAPPEHPFGTAHKTKAEAIEAEKDHHSCS